MALWAAGLLRYEGSQSLFVTFINCTLCTVMYKFFQSLIVHLIQLVPYLFNSITSILGPCCCQT